MMRKNIFIITILTLLPTITLAANYQLLEPLPSGLKSIPLNDPGTYIRSLYRYVLGLTVALSVLMIVIGGLEYTLTFASESKKGDAKNRITNAITGLLIALMAYLLLYTINPNLVNLKLKGDSSCPAKTTAAPAPNTSAPGSTKGSGATP